MEILIGITVGLLVVIAILVIRRRLNPSSAMPQVEYQAKRFDEIVKQDPRLKDFVLEAKQDGATHIADDGTISFYRFREEKYERRLLEYHPSGYWFWYSDWRKCEILPEHVLTIPDTF